MGRRVYGLRRRWLWGLNEGGRGPWGGGVAHVDVAQDRFKSHKLSVRRPGFAVHISSGNLVASLYANDESAIMCVW